MFGAGEFCSCIDIIKLPNRVSLKFTRVEVVRGGGGGWGGTY